MLLVSVSLKPSPIHGLGCFTNESIHEGQVVWLYDERIDKRIPADALPDLPAGIQEFLKVYGYTETVGGRTVITLCGDHSRHMNHASEPNTIDDPSHPGRDIAVRDIAAGEELTCNYAGFDLDAKDKLPGAQPAWTRPSLSLRTVRARPDPPAATRWSPAIAAIEIFPMPQHMID